MICPHCEYTEFTDEEFEEVNDRGRMFVLPVELKRLVGCHDWLSKRAALCACPKCFKTFVEEC